MYYEFCNSSSSEHVDLMPSEDGQVTETCKGSKYLQIKSHWMLLTIIILKFTNVHNLHLIDG
jgi:hypothetical protein